MLQALRKDELSAKDKIEELKSQLIEARRLIQKSNLPGVPEEYKVQLEKTVHILNEVTAKLKEKPLNIQAVQSLLEDAVGFVQDTFDETEAMLEEARLVERVIQYGNRYRSTHHSIAQSLEEAEEAFRHYEYKEALKQASAAIEQVDRCAGSYTAYCIFTELKSSCPLDTSFYDAFFAYYLVSLSMLMV